MKQTKKSLLITLAVVLMAPSAIQAQELDVQPTKSGIIAQLNNEMRGLRMGSRAALKMAQFKTLTTSEKQALSQLSKRVAAIILLIALVGGGTWYYKSRKKAVTPPTGPDGSAPAAPILAPNIPLAPPMPQAGAFSKKTNQGSQSLPQVAPKAPAQRPAEFGIDELRRKLDARKSAQAAPKAPVVLPALQSATVDVVPVEYTAQEVTGLTEKGSQRETAQKYEVSDLDRELREAQALVDRGSRRSASAPVTTPAKKSTFITGRTFERADDPQEEARKKEQEEERLKKAAEQEAAWQKELERRRIEAEEEKREAEKLKEQRERDQELQRQEKERKEREAALALQRQQEQAEREKAQQQQGEYQLSQATKDYANRQAIEDGRIARENLLKQGMSEADLASMGLSAAALGLPAPASSSAPAAPAPAPAKKAAPVAKKAASSAPAATLFDSALLQGVQLKKTQSAAKASQTAPASGLHGALDRAVRGSGVGVEGKTFSDADMTASWRLPGPVSAGTITQTQPVEQLQQQQQPVIAPPAQPKELTEEEIAALRAAQQAAAIESQKAIAARRKSMADSFLRLDEDSDDEEF